MMERRDSGQKEGGKEDHSVFILMVLAAALLIRLLLIHAHPLYLDECLYSEMVEEQLHAPSMVPTYLDLPASWKPPVFFWVYAVPVALLKYATSDIEVLYRLPNIFLGLLNALLVYLLFRKIGGETAGLYAMAAYALCPLVIYTDLRVLIDTMNTTWILASLYFYFDGPQSRNILLGAAFAFLAAMTKSVVAFIIPAIVLAHYWQKKQLSVPFAVSLAAVPIGIALQYVILAHFVPNLAGEEFTFDVLGKVYKEGAGTDYTSNIEASYGNAFVFVHALFIAAALGLWRLWKKDLPLAVWVALTVFPFIASVGMIWYFYPFIPVLAYFSVKAIAYDPHTKTERYDAFFKLVFAMFIAINIAILYLWYGTQPNLFKNEKQIGEYLVGKNGTVFIGDYQPTITAISYKTLNERQKYGSYLDFGWVILARNDSEANQTLTTRAFAANYATDAYDVDQQDFAKLFWRFKMFRKQSNITEPRYVVSGMIVINSTAEWMNAISIPGYEAVMAGRESVLLKRTGN